MCNTYTVLGYKIFSVSLYFAKLIGKILRFPSATAKTQVNQANDLEMLSVVGG